MSWQVDVDVVADRPALGGTNGDAWHVTDRTLKRGRALTLHQVLVDDRYRLRDVHHIAADPLDRDRWRREVLARSRACHGDRTEGRGRPRGLGRLALAGGRARLGVGRIGRPGRLLLGHGGRGNGEGGEDGFYG